MHNLPKEYLCGNVPSQLLIVIKISSVHFLPFKLIHCTCRASGEDYWFEKDQLDSAALSILHRTFVCR